MTLRPIEKDFINWYENRKGSLLDNIHRFLFPNCKRCKSIDLTYKELMKLKNEVMGK